MSNNSYNQPQRRRNLRRGIAATLILVSTLVLISDRQQKNMLASGRLSADDISSKVMGFMALPIRGIENMVIGAKGRKNAYLENQILKEEVDTLRVYKDQVLDLKQRVKTFEKLLKLDVSSDVSLQRILARAVSENNGPFVHSALLNAGKNKGIKTGFAVMGIDGLYGHIVRTGQVSSRALLLNDLNSRISVMSQRSQSRAIMVGGNSKKPRLEYIAPESDWRAGDRVVTSGDGGVLPRGLFIGAVSKSHKQRLDVELSTQGKPVDWVWVLPFSPIDPPENSALIENEVKTKTSTSGISND